MTSPIGSSPSGPKHHAAVRAPVLVQFVHVHLTGGADAVMLAALPAHYFEITILFILCELGRR